MKKEMNNITTFEDHLENQYGKPGCLTRDEFEEGFEAFKLGILISEERKKLHLSQEELALRCGTNKSYISRIENDASDIRLSTLIRIIERGLGGRMRISVQF